jgi:hypothetical protein
MPVAREGEKQNERSDNQNAAGFKFVDAEFIRALTRRLLIRLWADG